MAWQTLGVRLGVAAWSRVAAPAVVLAAMTAAWLATGAGLVDTALFVAHEAAFVLVPGALLYAGLRGSALKGGRPSMLELSALGYALGLVLETGAFALTAALHVRQALWAYPPLAVVAGLALVRRRGGGWRARAAGEPTGAGTAWALALVCVAAVAYIVIAYFLFAPLPSRAGSVVYIPDLVFHLGVSAEALHHWPISDPKVAGVALPYETFIYMRLAAVSQITHIALPTVLFRLYILPLLVALIALLTLAGEALSGRRAVGVGAAALFVFIGQLGLDPHEQLVFANTVFFSFYDSPSFLCGLVLFLAAVILLLRLLERELAGGEWLLLAVFLVGCADAKAAILPVVIGGLVLYLLWSLVGRARRAKAAEAAPRAPWRASLALVLAVAVFVATYFVIYHGERGGLRLDPPGTLRTMSAVTAFEGPVAGAIGHPLFWTLAAVFGLIGFCGATMVGIPWALSERRLRIARGCWLLLAMLVAAFVPFFLFSHKGNSQNFFTYFGLCAGCLLSAQGIALAVGRCRPSARQLRALAAFALAWLVVLLAVAILPNALHHPARIRARYALWIGLPLVVVGALLVCSRRFRLVSGLLQFAALLAILLVGALDTPLHTGHYLVSALRTRSTVYAQDSPLAEGLTPGLQRALAWVRHHVPVSSVIAVNNQFSQPDGRSPDYYYYSAFGERRVFLEGWEDTIPAAALSDPQVTPFPDRLRLNVALFALADRRALQTMERSFGVRYLLVDRVHGPVNPRLASLGRLVFGDPQALVYQVSEAGPAIGVSG